MRRAHSVALMLVGLVTLGLEVALLENVQDHSFKQRQIKGKPRWAGMVAWWRQGRALKAKRLASRAQADPQRGRGRGSLARATTAALRLRSRFPLRRLVPCSRRTGAAARRAEDHPWRSRPGRRLWQRPRQRLLLAPQRQVTLGAVEADAPASLSHVAEAGWRGIGGCVDHTELHATASASLALPRKKRENRTELLGAPPPPPPRPPAFASVPEKVAAFR